MAALWVIYYIIWYGRNPPTRLMERFVGHLGAHLFCIVNSMPFWIDVYSIVLPSLAYQIHQIRSEIDAKNDFHLEFLVWIAFGRCLLSTSTHWISNTMLFFLGNAGYILISG